MSLRHYRAELGQFSREADQYYGSGPKPAPELCARCEKPKDEHCFECDCSDGGLFEDVVGCECAELGMADCAVHAEGLCCERFRDKGLHEPECGNAPLDRVRR